MAAVLMDLIKPPTRPTIGNTLLRIERQDERDDHNLLMINRVMYDTDSMNAGSDYMEMAQLLGDAALPAKRRRFSTSDELGKIHRAEGQDRATRLLNTLKPRAETTRKARPHSMRGGQNSAGELDSIRARSTTVPVIIRVRSRPSLEASKRRDQASRRGYVYLGRAQVVIEEHRRSEEGLQRLEVGAEHESASAQAVGAVLRQARL